MKNTISVIIPTYNEKMNIIPLVESIITTLSNGYEYEVIVVDDDSPDKTADVVAKNFKSNSRIKVFKRKGERELATAILFGIKKSKGDIIVGMDADFNHPPDKIPELIEDLKYHDMVIASRFIHGGGMEDRVRYLLTGVFNLFLKYVLGFPTSDNMSGFYAIGKKRLSAFPLKMIYRGYGEYHLRLVYLARSLGLSIGEVPVYYKNRINGESKSNLLKMLFQYLRVSIGLALSCY